MNEVQVPTLAITVFDEVSHMNAAFNNNFGGVTVARLIKQCNAIPEEIKELREANEANDEYGVRDAACDIMVFSLGALHLMGVNYNYDLRGDNYPRTIYNEAQDIEVAVNQILVSLETTLYPALQEALANVANETTTTTEIYQALLGIIDAAFGIYCVFGFPDLATEDMHAVYVSNMSKFCADQDVLNATVKKYEDLGMKVRSEGTFPTICVKSDIDQDVGDTHYPAGKFLKSTTYVEPVFA